jgi:hypothetical protein
MFKYILNFRKKIVSNTKSLFTLCSFITSHGIFKKRFEIQRKKYIT